MIKGEEKPKMPVGARNNLSEEAITKIENWVKAGALLDAGKDASAPIVSYASSVDDLRKFELAKMTPEQRDKQVETIGIERWKKVGREDQAGSLDGQALPALQHAPQDPGRRRGQEAGRRIRDRQRSARSRGGRVG